MRRRFFLILMLLGLFGLGRLPDPAHAQQEIPELTILLTDEFDEPALWPVVSGDTYRTEFVDGAYQISNDLAGTYVTSVQPGSVDHVYVETVVDPVDIASGAAYGVTCRWQDAHHFYAFTIQAEGRAAIMRFQNGAGTLLNAVDVSLQSGLNQVAGLCIGSNLHLVLNGEVVLTARDRVFGSGSNGMVVFAGQAGGVTVRFERLTLAAVNPDLSETPVEFYPGIGSGERLYLVRPGDTLDEIAARFDISTAVLMERNPHILDPDLVYTWQPLAIPGGAAFAAVVEPPELDLIPQTGPQVVFLHPPDLHPNVSVPFLHGEFENADAWLLDESLEAEIADDAYRLTNESEELFAAAVRPFDLPFVHVEVEGRLTSGGGEQFYGAVCRWQDPNNYYAFGSDGHGNLFIWRMQNGLMNTLSQAEISVDPGQGYQIGANCYGSLLTLYVDGVAVAQAIDPALSSGYFGVFVGPENEAEFRQLTAYLPANVLIEE
jgi:LysM repeat protein